jgi:hypothetical protein
MGEFWTPLTLLAFMVAADAALAQPTLSNVTGFDPTLLAGKTCQGSFDTSAGRAESEGALQLRFAVNGAMLTANVWRRFGSNAQNRAAYAITQPGHPSVSEDFRTSDQCATSPSPTTSSNMSTGRETGWYCTTTLGGCGGRATREAHITPI